MRLDSGRSAQKMQTRLTLLAAARALAAEGEQVTVTAAAARAGISRATAYRYFTSSETLAMEAALDATFATPEEVVGNEPDPRARVHRVRRYLIGAFAANEQAFRLFLARAFAAAAQDPDVQVRVGRRVPMFELALTPLSDTLPRTQVELLVLALSGVSGPEHYFVQRDVLRLPPDVAENVSRLTVDAVLDSFLPA